MSVLAVILGVGCRKPLAPNVDTNQPPETWITGAPQDTITARDENGIPRTSPVGTIPVRFHLYWAGSDPDGAVTGFYYAVVETIPVPPPGLSLPALPGPKPHDYHFTTRTDTTIVFNVSEFRPDRQHAFFLYAVDDKGKPDPTPARFIFNALDRFPPDPYIYEARAVGTIYAMNTPGVVDSQQTIVFVTDSLTGAVSASRPPRDTIPSISDLTFKWRGEPTIQGTYVTGYRYKLDDPTFVDLPADSTQRHYAKGRVAPGTKVFTLKVLDGAGGANETNRRFQMNYDPDTWFAGPDPALFPKVGRERYTEVLNWSPATLRFHPVLKQTLISSDSLVQLPAVRQKRETFYEIYMNRIYVRSEGDTVNMNSWVLFFLGGSDKDSPYEVPVKLNDPALADTQFVPAGEQANVIRPGPPNGNPIGHRFQYELQVTPFGRRVLPSASAAFPVYDAARVDRNPVIGAYVPMIQAGQVYFLPRAIDGNGGVDNRIPSARSGVLNIPPSDPLRSRVITFFVDKPPRFVPGPTFVPAAGQTFPTRNQLHFNLVATDDDPFDPDPARRPAGPGGPSQTIVLRWTVEIHGPSIFTGADTTYLPPGGYRASQPQITVDVPNYIAGTDVTARVELCDCSDCEISEGSGRCITTNIPFHVPPPAASARSRTSSMLIDPRPGFESESGGSKP